MSDTIRLACRFDPRDEIRFIGPDADGDTCVEMFGSGMCYLDRKTLERLHLWLGEALSRADAIATSGQRDGADSDAG